MQIIDELEVNQRGPYGGGVGMVSFLGNMDMALALRTMVIPTNREDTIYSYRWAWWERQGWLAPGCQAAHGWDSDCWCCRCC
jgi:hypothetical protein